MSGANELLEKLFKTNTVILDEGLKTERVIQIKKVSLRTMKPITDLIARVIEDLGLNKENLPTVDLQDPVTILKLISKYYDDVIALLVSLTDVPKDDLLDMAADHSLSVVQGVIALNKHFFTTKVMPGLTALGADAAS